MLQLVIQFIPVMFIGLMTYLSYRISTAYKSAGFSMLSELCWLLPKTPALDTFLLFVLQAVLVASVVVSTLARMSNHGVLTLDILYYLSVLMLILFHRRKESGNLLVKVNR